MMRTIRAHAARLALATAILSSIPLLAPGTAQAITIPWPLATFELGDVPAIPLSAQYVITDTTEFDLTVDSATIVSDHPDDIVSLDISACVGVTFHPGQSCTATLGLTPSSLGERTFTGTVSGTVSYNGIGLPITGTFLILANLVEFDWLAGAYLGAALPGTVLPWGAVYTNSSIAPVTLSSLEMTIGGADAADLTADVSDCVRTLQVGDSCTIGGTFTVSGLGARSATLDVDADVNGIPAHLEVDVHADGVAGPVTVSPTSIAFPTTAVRGTPSTADATLTNTSGVPQSVDSVGIDGANGADFAVASDGCSGATLAVDASCVVTVAFAPTDRGARSASLLFVTTAPNTPLAVALAGTGIAPVVASDPAALSFGAVPVGTTSSQQVLVVSNVGDAPLHATGMSFAGSDPGAYVVTDDTCTGATVAVGSTCIVAVAFTPQGLGPSSASLVVTDDEVAGQSTVALSGTGSPAADLAVALRADASRIGVGQTLTYTATVRNAGPNGSAGVVLTFKMPPSTAFGSASLPCTTPDPGSTGAVVCSLGLVPNGSTVTLQVAVSVTSASGKKIHASASVAAGTFDPHPKNDAARVTTRVGGAGHGPHRV